MIYCRRLISLACIIFSVTIAPVFAQDAASIDYNIPNKKGSLYVFWGWNVDTYSKSNISFKGDNYDFKLKDVVAVDKQNAWDPSLYLGITTITIPQTNFKFGYFISDHYAISAGVDHMKYVMVQNQSVKIDGSISNGAGFDGTYNNDDIILTEDFLTFEHTDGLNYLNVEIERVDDILKMFKKGNKNLEINTVLGVGVGGLLPKTNAKLMNNERYDDFNLAGYGIDAKIGLNITFFKYFFVQSELKGGFIHMPNIRTTQFKADKASQAFTFGQANFLFGVIFKVSKK